MYVTLDTRLAASLSFADELQELGHRPTKSLTTARAALDRLGAARAGSRTVDAAEPRPRSCWSPAPSPASSSRATCRT